MPGFKASTRMLMMGQRAERLRQEKIMAEESEKMRHELRSTVRQRTSLHRKMFPHLHNQNRWAQELRHKAADLHLQRKVATCSFYLREDTRDLARLDGLIATVDRFKEDAAELNDEIETLQKKLREVEENLLHTKKIIAERKQECDKCRVPCVDKISRRMESACKSLGDELRQNRDMMAEIHHLVLEKAVVSKTHSRLEKELQKLSRQLLADIDIATETYRQRDRTRQGTAQIREHYERSTVAFHNEMNIYDQKIGALVNMERFMTTKGKCRFEEYARKRATLLQQLSPNERDIAFYKETSVEVSTALNSEEDLVEVVNDFIQTVEENFMLFMNISETREKCSQLQMEIDVTKDRIKKAVSHSRNTNFEAKEQQQELIEKKSAYWRMAEEKQRLLDAAVETIRKYVRAVREVLDKMGYKDEDILRIAGVIKRVKEKNVVRFLSEIEQFVGRLWDLQTFRFFKLYTNKQRISLGLSDPVIAMPPRTVLKECPAVVTPSFDVDEEVKLPEEADKAPLPLKQITKLVESDLKEHVHFGSGTKKPTSSTAAAQLSAISEESSGAAPTNDVF